MSGQFRNIEALTLSALLWLSHGEFTRAADEAAPKPNQLEPIEFIDNARPQQNDPASRRPAVLNPTGWGFAVFSPDSKTVATISVPDGTDSKGEVIFWDVASPKPDIHFTQSGRIAAAVFSPDGKWLALGPHAAQSGVKLIDAKTGQLHQTLPGAVSRTNTMAWSPDGKELVLASTMDRSIRVWNVADKKFVKTYEPEASSIYAVGFTKSGQLLAAGIPLKDRDAFVIFDVAAGKVDKTLKGHKELVESAVFTADAAIAASVGWDATLRIWDVASGEETAAIKGHKKGLRSVAMSADGKRIASCNDREFKLWDGEKKEFLADLGGENAGAKFVSMSPDGAWMVSISRDGTAHLWDAETKTEKAKLDRNPGASAAAEGDDETPTARPATPPVGDSPEPEAIQSIAYSRDGKWIALAREDGRISIRTAADGKVAREIDAFNDVASCVAFSHDSQSIAAGSFNKSAKVWNVATGEVRAELNGHTNWIFSVAFSPDGLKLATGGYDKTVRLWNIADAKEIATLSGHTAGVRSVAFSIDGQRLISGSADRTAIVWDLADAKSIATLKGHSAAVRAVAWSPDGATVATASEDASVKLWKTADWTERASMTGTEGVMFWCLAFSPAGRTLAAGAFDGSVKLYDPSDGKERKTLRGPTEAITAIAFAPDAHEIVAGSVDKSLRRWKAETGPTSVATMKTADADKPPELKSSDAVTALNATILNVERPVLSLAYNKSATRLVVGTGAYRGPGNLQFWDISKREKIWQSDESKFGLPAVALSHDESRIAVGNFADNFVRLMDATNGKQLKEIRGHRAKVTGIAYSPNGKYFATASLDRDVKLWDAATNKEVKTFIGHADYVYSIEFSLDGQRLLSGSSDRTARLWDIATGKELLQLKGHQGSIQQAVFSHDGKFIATASADGMVRVSDATTGDFLFSLRGHRNKVDSVAFSPNGHLIATGSSDRTIRLWDAASGAERLKMTQESVVRIVVFSPDGKHLASGCDDKTVKLWDVSQFGKEEPAAAESQAP